MDKAAISVLCVLLLFRICRSESDPYDLEDDAYSAPYLVPHIDDEDRPNDYEYVYVAADSASGGGTNLWGGADILMEATRFGNRLRNFANEELGIATFQAAYDGRAYVNDISLADKAGQMARKLQLKLQAYEEALAANRKLMEDLHTQHKKLGQPSYTVTGRVAEAPVDCCELSSTLLRDDIRYAIPVATQIMCDLQASFSASDLSIPRADLTEAFKNNSRRLPGLKWQYFISLKSNVHAEYPAHAFPLHRDGSCQLLAYHRHRASLLGSLRGPRKTMVIVIDNGCSLSDNQMSSAIAVADLLIESLADTDHVAVLSVANETTHLSALLPCMSPAHVAAHSAARADKVQLSRGSAGQSAATGESYFLQPSADIKQHLRKVMGGVVQAAAMTNHTLAFVTAFGILHALFNDQSPIKDDDDVSIAYISRGLMSTLSDARQVLSAIQAENARLRARVRIDVYALIDSGKPLIYEGIFLRDIATQNASRFDLDKDTTPASQRKPPLGRLVNVTSRSDLRPVVDSLLPLGAARVRFPNQQAAAAAATTSAAGRRITATPYYSALHLDVADRGPVLSIVLPCLDEASGSAFGALGMDVHQADLAEDVLHFDSSSEHLYAFIVSTSGQTLAHPMIARSSGGGAQPGFVNTDIRILETEPGFAALFSSMSSSANGTTTLSPRTCGDNASSTGACKPDPVSIADAAGSRKDHVVTYSWQRVSERSQFVMVLKQVHAGTAATAAPRRLVSAADSGTSIMGTEAVMYHRLDLLPTENTCFYFGQLASFDASTIFLSPKAFRNSYDYLHKLETRSSGQNYVAYLRDTSGLISNPGIKEDVRQDVAVTALLHSYWLERGRLSPHSSYIARRYVATPRGVARTYPGVALSKAFEPTTTPWYLRASASPGRLTLVASRGGSAIAAGQVSGSSAADAGGSSTGLLASICQTVYEGSALALHTSSDPVAAVIGLDVSAQFLYKWLAEAMPGACGATTGTGNMRCFLVDDAGYVVAHPHLTRTAGGSSSSGAAAGVGPVEQNHITYMEPLLAADLIAHKDFAMKKLCNNMADRTMQRYYVFNTSMVGVKQNIKIGDACVRYQITAVPRTNVFLIIANDTCSPTMPAFCPCSTTDRLCLNCDRAEQSECECPCECHARFGLAYGACDGRAASTAADRGGEISNASVAIAAPGSLRAAGTQAVEEDRGQNCWPVTGDSWESASLVLPPASMARSLPPCRAMPDCSNHTSARSCLGVLGCEWCSEQAAATDLLQDRAPLSRPYCAARRHCLGGVFRLESVNEDQDALAAMDSASVTDPLRSAATAAPVGPVAGAVMGTFLLVALGVYCYRHYSSRRNSATAECQRSAAGQELCIPLAAGPDLGRGQLDPAPPGAPVAEAAAVHGHVNLLLLIDQVANVSPYRMNANYRRPHYAAAATTTESSDRGYSSLTQADDMDDSAASVLSAGAAAAAAATADELGAGALCHLSPAASQASLSGCASATCPSRGDCSADCNCSGSLESAPLLPPLPMVVSSAAETSRADGRRRRNVLQQSGSRRRGVWPSSRGSSEPGSCGKSVGQYTRLSAVPGKASVACSTLDSRFGPTQGAADAAAAGPCCHGLATVSAASRRHPEETVSGGIQETDVG